MRTEPAPDGVPVVTLNVNERRILADCSLLLTKLGEPAAEIGVCRIGQTEYVPGYFSGLSDCLKFLWAIAIEAEPPEEPVKPPKKKVVRKAKKKP